MTAIIIADSVIRNGSSNEYVNIATLLHGHMVTSTELLQI